jgi:hypothetical protein
VPSEFEIRAAFALMTSGAASGQSQCVGIAVDSERLVAHERVMPLRVWRLQRKREETVL